MAMSVNKLLSRIVNPPDCSETKFSSKMDEIAFVHERTLGLSSDPLTIFSCVLAALSHDVGHRGLTNFDLAKEDPLLDKKFCGKSIAEQNSMDIAWSILLLPDFSNLRRCIFSTTAELRRFRSLLVNSLIATGTSLLHAAIATARDFPHREFIAIVSRHF